eukprot:gb/GFBE01022100.1/.p1 GENE.gb/GFBE01022100.1/~~gb/GFBE01022100.1/.p1  ORF type:complete len:211 (+),score=81.64 gb/GFBE01022100.1/:1-633(+)
MAKAEMKKRKAASEASATKAEDGGSSGTRPAEQIAKVTGAAGWKGFCTAFASIMARSLTLPDAPVLAETEIEQKLRERKAEFKEKKLQSLENKAVKDQGHALPDITQKNFELQLRKAATQGVVRLFNAVRDFQAHAGENEEEKLELNKVPLKKRAKVIAASKEGKFKDVLKKAKQPKQPKAKRSSKTGAASQSANAASGADGHNQLDEFG